MKLDVCRQIFKFHENSSGGSRVVSCVQTDGRTDMTKLIVAFRNFVNAPKNSTVCPHSVICINIRRNNDCLSIQH
jgi:hypothetical protein